MTLISRKQILAQLKRDLIGKDAYRGVTLTYAWMANQFGHFSLGFIPTFILYTIFLAKTHMSHPEIWAAVAVWGAWLLFELYNFLGPLLLNTSAKQVTAVAKGYTFKPAWANVTFDTLTDLCFFGIGAGAASLICKWSVPIAVGLGVLLLLVIYPTYYWYVTKMCLQQAGYPFQLRLSQWNFGITEKHKQTILNFMDANTSGKHLLLFGSKGSGKTSLSVGIATEASIKKNCCSYVTATKLLAMFFEEKDTSANNTMWSWHDSAVLVIDDINPGGLIKDDILTASLFFELINNAQYGSYNMKQIREKNVIWVMGNEDSIRKEEQKWETLLGLIGVHPADIISVNLGNEPNS